MECAALVKSLSSSVADIGKKLTSVLGQIEIKRAQYEKELASPFTTPDKIQLAISGIVDQVGSIKLRIKDCERLEELCR